MRTTVPAVFAIATVFIGCSAGLHPRTTLRGVPQLSDKAKQINAGQTASEVRATLGDPASREAREEERVWLYFEEFQPRSCEHRTERVEVLVIIQEGLVDRLVVQDDAVADSEPDPGALRRPPQ